MTHGDEWKEGTEYEDPEDRAEREMCESARDMAEGLAAMASTFDNLMDALRQLNAGHAVSRLIEMGWDKKDAVREIRLLWIQAEAEDRGFAPLVKDFLMRADSEGSEG